jgi:hypothetical protein
MWTGLVIFQAVKLKGSFGVKRYFEELWTTMAEVTNTR